MKVAFLAVLFCLAILETAVPEELRQPPLLELVHAGGFLRGDLGLGKRGKQHRGKNSDDGDDDQQLDQREPTAGLVLGGARRLDSHH